MTFWNLESAARNNPKVAAVGKDGFTLWAMAALYAAEQLTDGFVPQSELERIVAAWKLAPGTIKACLASTVPGKGSLFDIVAGGVTVHDWPDYNTAAVQIKKLNTERRRAGKKGAEVRWGSNGHVADANGKCHMAKDDGNCLVGRSVGMSDPDPKPEIDARAREAVTETWETSQGLRIARIAKWTAANLGGIPDTSNAQHAEVHLAQLAEEEAEAVVELFCDDPDTFLADNGHCLRFLKADRVNRYLAQLRKPKPPEIKGITMEGYY